MAAHWGSFLAGTVFGSAIGSLVTRWWVTRTGKKPRNPGRRQKRGNSG
jgi:Na+/glutamate symporter